MLNTDAPQPSHEPHAPGECAEAAPAAPAAPADAGSPRRVRTLLVEDHPDTLRIMARLLTSLGHDVAAAKDARAALAILEQGRVDLLVSDVGLPDGSGLDVMRAAARRGIRGIAVSGFGSEDDLRRSREAGFAIHLTKPVAFKTVTDAIRTVLGLNAA